jgi:hypothetical protein
LHDAQASVTSLVSLLLPPNAEDFDLDAHNSVALTAFRQLAAASKNAPFVKLKYSSILTFLP